MFPKTCVELLRRLRSGDDQGAWRDFQKDYRPLICSVAGIYGVPSGAVDGLVQDVLVRVFRVIRTFVYQPERGRFRSWLWRVTVNEILQRRRADRRRTQATRRYLPRASKRDLTSSSPGRRSVEREEQWRQVESGLRELRDQVPAEQFSIFYLAAIQGMDRCEVAAWCGRPKEYVSLVKCRLGRKLRAIVERETSSSESHA